MSRLDIVRKIANRIAQKYELDLPVNLNKIISGEKIIIKKEHNKLGIDGYSKLNSTPIEIILNTEITFEPRIQFTTAHELGHYFISWHNGDVAGNTFGNNGDFAFNGRMLLDSQEMEANTFASELLMPTAWLKNLFEKVGFDMDHLIDVIQGCTKSSIMASIYALQNAYPSGHLIFVSTREVDYWKIFSSGNTYPNRLPYEFEFQILNKISLAAQQFSKSNYQIQHFELFPTPEDEEIKSVYKNCQDFERTLLILSKGNPIHIIHLLKKILECIDDNYYLTINIEDQYIWSIRSKDSAIRLHLGEDISYLDKRDIVFSKFTKRGELQLCQDAKILWIKDEEISDQQWPVYNSRDLLKIILAEVYSTEAPKMSSKINGIIGNANSSRPEADFKTLCGALKSRFAGDHTYAGFVSHRLYESFIVNRVNEILYR